MEVFMAYQAAPDFDLAYAVQLAILHDTIEDTNSSFADLEELFGTAVAEGVQALTKNEELQKAARMPDALQRINLLPKEVGLVKLADRITNLQEPPPHWSMEKTKKYLEEAKLISNSLENKNAYLNNRILEKIQVYAKFIN